MTTIAISPVWVDKGMVSYCAVAGTKHSEGETIGAALDALTTQLDGQENSYVILVQSYHPDPFFTAVQQARMHELIAQRQAAQENGEDFPTEKRAELQALIEAELVGATNRAAAWASQMGK